MKITIYGWSTSIPSDELGDTYGLKADIMVNQLDPSDSTIDLLLHLERDTIFKDIFVGAGKRLLDESGKVRERYQNLQAQLKIETPFSQDVTQSIPLSRLEDFLTTIRLPLNARPNRYPQDWYEGSALVTVILPEGLEFVPRAEDIGNPGRLMTVKLSLRTPPDTGVVIYYQLTHEGDPIRLNSPDVQGLRLLIRRDPPTRAYVWTMALIPLLLILIALTQIFQSRRREPSGPGGVWPISLEAVALLAILPLRQVLVPPEIRGLTTIDFLLGAELAAFIALIAAQYIVASFRRQ